VNRPALIKAACYALDAAGMAVSRRSVQGFLRKAFDRGFSTDEIAPVVLDFKKRGPVEVQAGSKPGPSSVLKKPVSGPNEVQSRSSRARVAKVLESEALLLLPSGKSPASNGQVPKPEKEPLPWVDDLRRAMAMMERAELAALSVPQRVTLGRYHALAFENFSVSEVKNKNRGAKHVAAIAELGRSNLGDVTVEEYCKYMRHLLKETGALIRSPWALKGAIEAEV
jgi:hypothetical protein